MEGTAFYLLAWFSWIVATFFMKKNVVRLRAAFSILLIIIGSEITCSIGPFQISVSFCILLVIGLVGLAVYSRWRKLYAIVCATIIAMVYSTFHLIEIYDPIWIAIDRMWMLSALLVYTSFLLIRHLALRVFIIIIGMVQGEMLLTAVLYKYGFHNELGSEAFLDVMALSIVLLCTLHLAWKGFSYTNPLKHKYIGERQG